MVALDNSVKDIVDPAKWKASWAHLSFDASSGLADRNLDKKSTLDT